jgi:hypothetical protein
MNAAVAVCNDPTAPVTSVSVRPSGEDAYTFDVDGGCA